MTPSRKPAKPEKRDYKVPVIVGIVVLAVAFGISKMISGPAGHKKVVETMEIKMVPPPPPPPPPKEPPPPPPPKLVEQKITPPQDKPPEAKPAEAPPPGPLALDAKGGAGSDSFGLGGKLGGSDYIAGGGGSRVGYYGRIISTQITRRLHEDEKLDSSKYNGTVKVWFSPAGKVVRVEILHSTGDRDIDERIRQQVMTMQGLPEAVPQDLGPAIVRVGARPPSES